MLISDTYDVKWLGAADWTAAAIACCVLVVFTSAAVRGGRTLVQRLRMRVLGGLTAVIGSTAGIVAAERIFVWADSQLVARALTDIWLFQLSDSSRTFFVPLAMHRAFGLTRSADESAALTVVLWSAALLALGLSVRLATRGSTEA